MERPPPAHPARRRPRHPLRPPAACSGDRQTRCLREGAGLGSPAHEEDLPQDLHLALLEEGQRLNLLAFEEDQDPTRVPEYRCSKQYKDSAYVCHHVRHRIRV